MRTTLMKALVFYTTNSPTTGAILHGDPRPEADELARYPEVSDDDADFLESQKLAKRYEGATRRGRAVEYEDVGARGARLMEEDADADQAVEQPTGLDTRNTTAFERPPHLLAGGGARSLTADDQRDGPDEEEEAPAGGGKRSSKADKNEGKALSEQNTAELEKTAADEKVDLSSAKNNDQRRELIQKARDSNK